MDKVFKLRGGITTKQLDEDTIEIEGYASTRAEDRDGDVILPEAWESGGGLKNFLNNPIILYNHNHNMPIGKATDITTDEKGLYIRAKVIKSVAGNVFDLIKEGIVKSFSVGFAVHKADFKEELGRFGGFLIREAELLETSAVTVPANQEAIFSIAKSFDNDRDLEEFRKRVDSNYKSVKAEQTFSSGTAQRGEKPKEKKMDDQEFDLESLVSEIVSKTAEQTAEQITTKEEQRRAAEKAEAEAADRAEKDAAEAKEKAEQREKEIVRVTMSGAQKLVEDLRAEIADKDGDFDEKVNELKSIIAEKEEELTQMRGSKAFFSGREGASNGDWRKEFSDDLTDAMILAKATKSNWHETDFGKDIIKAVNTHSGVEVSSADFEQEVSSNIQRDIELQLVLAPLFREVQMRSASMILPILPDAGYAEFTGNPTASGIDAKGNLESRANQGSGSPYAGVDLTEKTISTKKLISRSYLGNETEEDAIIPILPLLRESMIRSHARGVEQMILAGNHADGAYGVGGASPNGLIALADTDGHQTNDGASGFAATDAVEAADLMTIRREMGKYAVKPDDIYYIVSLDAYYDLIEDDAFQDVQQVGDLSMKVNGEVGRVYGTRVIVSDEFATKAAAKFCAVAVNPRNYIIPRLRGFTVESDNEVGAQRRVLVVSQRIGFEDIINTAKSKWGFQYKLA